MITEDIVREFDRYLVEQGISFRFAIIGGAALNLLGISDRGTFDLDVVTPDIPDEVKVAARDFADVYSKRSGEKLDDNWLNDGAAAFRDILPKDWESRREEVFKGEAIQVDSASRLDLLKTKVYALTNRDDPEIDDIVSLNPTRAELTSAQEYVMKLEDGREWRELVSARVRTISSILEEEREHSKELKR